MGRHRGTTTQQIYNPVPSEPCGCACEPKLLSPASSAGLYVKAAVLNLLHDVFLLHSALEPTKRVLKELSLFDLDFRQTDYTPKPIPSGPDSYCKLLLSSQEEP
jgi:hypothetical protein